MQTIWQNPQNQSSTNAVDDSQNVTVPMTTTTANQNNVTGGQRIQSQHQAVQTKPLIANSPLPITSTPTTNLQNKPTLVQKSFSSTNNAFSHNQIQSSSFSKKDEPSVKSLPDKEMVLNKMEPAQREEVLTKVFSLILGRKPTIKDIGYYKYSILTEQRLKESLLKGKEHQDLITQGKQYTTTQKAYTNLKLEMKFMEDKLRTLVEEYNILKKLLYEKNSAIQILRQNINKLQVTNSMPINQRVTIPQEVKQSIKIHQPQATVPQNKFDQYYNEKSVVNNIDNPNKTTKSPFKLLVSQFKELLSPPY